MPNRTALLAQMPDGSFANLKIGAGGTLTTGADAISVNKGVTDVGRSTPLFSRSTPSVAAGAASALITVATVPAGRAWLIATSTVTTPAGVTVAELRLGGVQTGQTAAASSTSERNVKAFFGDYVLVTGNVQIVASNSGTAAASPTITLYGWDAAL